MIDIDMRLLRSFVSVATERNFSRAAERLGCSQATVSLRIKSLEDILGRRLFNRSYHLVELSVAGKELLPHAQIILDHHDALFDKMRSGKVSGSVSLGIAEDYGEPFLSRLMRVIDSSFPGIELNVTCAMSVRLQKLLESRKLDLAIVTLPNQRDRSTLLSRPKLVWVSSGDYVVDRKKPWPMAFYSEGCAFRAAAEAALKREGHAYREVLTTGSGEAIKSAVSSGTAITVMAEGIVPYGFSLLQKEVGLPELPESCIQLVEREDGLSKAAQQVKVSIMKLLGVSADHSAAHWV
ncbi:MULTISPECIES: LysR family transcriptional regulator [unclassified Rhizobium]|uniref:LysR family transcriptional regulator n=1 Tax=unclassified Rhizobium TaxID=2613769 RepID=UPI0007EA6E3D|nr:MULTISPECIES: LysR family transcriptional regulator [unclassified Rhizobium]ANM14738.1 LysR family transcriptional regulator protein [Rhizobium sp. N324]OYC99841.1 LysR family transcriptional regulator protein [Rhizobium sp. N4311]